MTNRTILAPVALASAVIGLAGWTVTHGALASAKQDGGAGGSDAIHFSAPAGDLPAMRHINIDGYDGAVLPSGRLITPAGREVAVNAPKPFGLAVAPNGTMLATVNSGTTPFSVSLIKNINTNAPTTAVVRLSSTFMGVTFSPDSSRFYAAGGDNGMIWVGNTATATISGSVNLNGQTHPFGAPMNPAANPSGRFKGTYPGNLTLGGPNGRYLYVVDQGTFNVFVIDTTKIQTGVNQSGAIIEPNNFAAVVGQAKAGRYPYGIASTADGRLLVANVGVFQFSHLTPKNSTGNPNVDYPLGYPGTSWPDDMEHDKTIKIKKVDPRNLPLTLRDPEGVRVGYVDQDVEYTIPGLGDPNTKESSSVYVFSLAAPTAPALVKRVKTGPLVGEVERGIASYSGSHPNAVAVGPHGVYVSNGNNDSISILDPDTFQEVHRVSLNVLDGADARIKGVQPVSVALSPDAKYLYVAEAGINAIAVIRLQGDEAEVLGHIPTGWWPSAVLVSADAKTLYVASAKGRGAGPTNNFPPDNHGSPRSSTLGTVNIIPVPDRNQLEAYTERVMKNNGFVERGDDDNHQGNQDDHGKKSNPIPTQA